MLTVRILEETEIVSLTIDGKQVRAAKDEKILWAALDNGIYIPNLCGIRDRNQPSASCRLCFVELEGKRAPVTACTTTVADGMVVNTKGERASRLARGSFELLLSNLPLDCAHCPKSGSCEIQKIAKHLRVRLNSKRFRKTPRDLPIDSSSPVFIYDPNKCVLCGRCVWVCEEKLGIGAIGFAHRGFERMVTTFGGEPIGQSSCKGCGDCVNVCPSGALLFKEKN
jgi:bidirectional [NiFe] hydrogenase diaphorase subunit